MDTNSQNHHGGGNRDDHRRENNHSQAPPVNDQTEEESQAAQLKAIHDAMLEELGIGRKDTLPLEDRGLAVENLRPISRPTRNDDNPWNKAVFDVDPGTGELDSIAGGMLHRLRRGTPIGLQAGSNSNGRGGSGGRFMIRGDDRGNSGFDIGSGGRGGRGGHRRTGSGLRGSPSARGGRGGNSRGMRGSGRDNTNPCPPPPPIYMNDGRGGRHHARIDATIAKLRFAESSTQRTSTSHRSRAGPRNNLATPSQRKPKYEPLPNSQDRLCSRTHDEFVVDKSSSDAFKAHNFRPQTDPTPEEDIPLRGDLPASKFALPGEKAQYDDAATQWSILAASGVASTNQFVNSTAAVNKGTGVAKIADLSASRLASPPPDVPRPQRQSTSLALARVTPAAPDTGNTGRRPRGLSASRWAVEEPTATTRTQNTDHPGVQQPIRHAPVTGSMGQRLGGLSASRWAVEDPAANPRTQITNHATVQHSVRLVPTTQNFGPAQSQSSDATYANQLEPQPSAIVKEQSNSSEQVPPKVQRGLKDSIWAVKAPTQQPVNEVTRQQIAPPVFQPAPTTSRTEQVIPTSVQNAAGAVNLENAGGASNSTPTAFQNNATLSSPEPIRVETGTQGLAATPAITSSQPQESTQTIVAQPTSDRLQAAVPYTPEPNILLQPLPVRLSRSDDPSKIKLARVSVFSDHVGTKTVVCVVEGHDLPTIRSDVTLATSLFVNQSTVTFCEGNLSSAVWLIGFQYPRYAQIFQDNALPGGRNLLHPPDEIAPVAAELSTPQTYNNTPHFPIDGTTAQNKDNLENLDDESDWLIDLRSDPLTGFQASQPAFRSALLDLASMSGDDEIDTIFAKIDSHEEGTLIERILDNVAEDISADSTLDDFQNSLECNDALEDITREFFCQSSVLSSFNEEEKSAYVQEMSSKLLQKAFEVRDAARIEARNAAQEDTVPQKVIRYTVDDMKRMEVTVAHVLLPSIEHLPIKTSSSQDSSHLTLNSGPVAVLDVFPSTSDVISLAKKSENVMFEPDPLLQTILADVVVQKAQKPQDKLDHGRDGRIDAGLPHLDPVSYPGPTEASTARESNPIGHIRHNPSNSDFDRLAGQFFNLRVSPAKAGESTQSVGSAGNGPRKEITHGESLLQTLEGAYSATSLTDGCEEKLKSASTPTGRSTPKLDAALNKYGPETFFLGLQRKSPISATLAATSMTSFAVPDHSMSDGRIQRHGTTGNASTLPPIDRPISTSNTSMASLSHGGQVESESLKKSTTGTLADSIRATPSGPSQWRPLVIPTGPEQTLSFFQGPPQAPVQQAQQQVPFQCYFQATPVLPLLRTVLIHDCSGSLVPVTGIAVEDKGQHLLPTSPLDATSMFPSRNTVQHRNSPSGYNDGASRSSQQEHQQRNKQEYVPSASHAVPGTVATRPPLSPKKNTPVQADVQDRLNRSLAAVRFSAPGY